MLKLLIFDFRCKIDFLNQLLSIVIMVVSLKIFQFIQKFQKIIGIHPIKSNRWHRSNIFRRAFFLIANAQFVLPTIAYLVFEGDTMFQFGMGVFISISSVTSVTIYFLFVWQLENMLKFIGICEEFIKKSTYYSQIHRRFCFC